MVVKGEHVNSAEQATGSGAYQSSGLGFSLRVCEKAVPSSTAKKKEKGLQLLSMKLCNKVRLVVKKLNI